MTLVSLGGKWLRKRDGQIGPVNPFPEALLDAVKSSGIRQSQITKRLVLVSLGGKWLIIMDKNITMNATMRTNMNPVYIFFYSRQFQFMGEVSLSELFLPLFSQFESSPGMML